MNDTKKEVRFFVSWGKVAFEAYSQKVGGKAYDNKPIPQWESLSLEVQQGWEAAARAVIATLNQV